MLQFAYIYMCVNWWVYLHVIRVDVDNQIITA